VSDQIGPAGHQRPGTQGLVIIFKQVPGILLPSLQSRLNNDISPLCGLMTLA